MFNKTILSSVLIATLSSCSSGSSDDPVTNPLAIVSDGAASNEVTEVTEVTENVVINELIEPSNELSDQTQSPEPVVGPCVDTDGDGFGWNGVASCTVLSETTEVINSEEPAADPTQDREAVVIPYIDRYETYTLANWLGVQSADAMWPPVGAVVEATNGWTGVRNHPVIHLVLCEDPDNTIMHPSIPGYFYDTAKGQTCSQNDTVVIPAPGEPVEFTEIGHEVLFENGNQWNCRTESRPSMDTEFEATGATQTVTYEDSTSLFFPGGPNFAAEWGFVSHRSYEDHTLTWYQTGLRRDVCDRIVVRNFPFSLYGEEKGDLYREAWNTFVGDGTPRAPEAGLDVLPAVQLADQALQCAHLSSTSNRIGGDVVSFSNFHLEVSVEAVGGNEYNVSGFPLGFGQADQVWTENADGGLSGPPDLTFYSYSEDLSIVRSESGGPLGSSTQTTSEFYACEAI